VNPETHLLASWVIGAKTTNNARDCRLVALAGILPDLDGLGLGVDLISRVCGAPKTFFFMNATIGGKKPVTDSQHGRDGLGSGQYWCRKKSPQRTWQ
jgi:hypothetical protein